MSYIFLFISLVSFYFLIAGLLNPAWAKIVTRKILTRKQIAKVFCSAIAISVLGVGLFAPDAPTTDSSEKQNISKISVTQQENDSVTSTTSGQIVALVPNIEESKAEQENAPSNEPSQDSGTPVESDENKNVEPSVVKQEQEQEETEAQTYYKVASVVDGDTIDVYINGTKERLRLIGLNTPETKDPRKPVECFGKEASAKATQLLLGQEVTLEADPTQGERDKYGRLLRYVHRKEGLHFNKWMIENGYAYEYTYNTPYKYQSEFKTAQRNAQNNKLGLWADGVCDEPTTNSEAPSENTQVTESVSGNCTIKGNINSKDEKLYHLPSCPSYNRTTIDESKGEKWFCSEQDAINAGWTKAGNC